MTHDSKLCLSCIFGSFIGECITHALHAMKSYVVVKRVYLTGQHTVFFPEMATEQLQAALIWTQSMTLVNLVKQAKRS